ncbi:amidohydrolase family protein [Niabella terrae]
MEIIDTHIHIWDRSVSAYSWLNGAPPLLQRTYDLEELEAGRIQADISGGLLVQADNTLADTEWMLAAARTHPWISGVVGWLPLTDPETSQVLLHSKWQEEPLLKGVRHLIHDEADPRWLLQPQVLESLELLAELGIPFDVVGVLPAHLQTVLELKHRVPKLRMVLDHLNQPPIQEDLRFGSWGELIRELAESSNIYAKISGLGVTAGKPLFTVDRLQPYVSFVLERFGLERCFCGGDWPVSLLAADYTATWTIYRQLIQKLLPETAAQELIFSVNARNFYALGPSA